MGKRAEREDQEAKTENKKPDLTKQKCRRVAA
jgi:hypothetical protein